MGYLINFEKGERNTKVYLGDSGNQRGITLDGIDWIVKLPKSMREMNKPQRSYTTSPLSEFIGSHIYEICDIPVHETKLGTYRGKLVVSCRDFLEPWETLNEFRGYKNAHVDNDYEDPHSGSASSISITSGRGTDLSEVLAVLDNDEVLSSVRGVKERFWDMFVVDALIGNNDRNNDNWGLIRSINNTVRLAPVYDNGNSFYNKRGDDSFIARGKDEKALLQDAFGTPVSVYFVPGTEKHIHPFDYLEQSNEADLNAAISRIVASFDMDAARAFFDSIPVEEDDLVIFSEPQRNFYLDLLEARCNKLHEIAVQNSLLSS